MIKLLIVLPLAIIANIIAGASLGRQKQEFDKDKLMNGIIKGLMVYIVIGLLFAIDYFMPDFSFTFGETTATISSALYLLGSGEFGWYLGQVFVKLVALAQHKQEEQTEILIDENIEDDGGMG